MNTFERIHPHEGGQPAWKSAGGYALYHASFKPPKRMQTQGGKIVFHRVLGSVEVYLDGKLLTSSFDPSVVIDLPSPVTPGVMMLLVHSPHPAPAGIAAEVELI